jgi:2-(1,2-epoxy-1,2-dihydrophenyl)acetyl-CoA isomerase
VTDAPLLIERAEGYHILTLNRPERLNAFTEELHRLLRAALQAAGDDEACRAVLLTGAGRAFCTGQDLAARRFERDKPPDLARSLQQFYNPLIRALRALPKPVVCAVNGVAAGAGANLALACDIVVAGRSARFIQSFARVGLIPDGGGTWTLPRLVGPARARALMLLAEPVTADQAADWGMIWQAVDDASLLPTAHALCAKLAALPPIGLALTKRALEASGGNDLDRQLDLERDLQGEAGRTADYREGVAAFLEKRPPRFTGKR